MKVGPSLTSIRKVRNACRRQKIDSHWISHGLKDVTHAYTGAHFIVIWAAAGGLGWGVLCPC